MQRRVQLSSSNLTAVWLIVSPLKGDEELHRPVLCSVGRGGVGGNGSSSHEETQFHSLLGAGSTWGTEPVKTKCKENTCQQQWVILVRIFCYSCFFMLTFSSVPQADRCGSVLPEEPLNLCGMSTFLVFLFGMCMCVVMIAHGEVTSEVNDTFLYAERATLFGKGISETYTDESDRRTLPDLVPVRHQCKKIFF